MDFFTNTVSPRPPSSFHKKRRQKNNCKFHHAEKYLKAGINARTHNFMVFVIFLESLTGDCLSQDELHLLFGSLFGVFNQFVDSVSSWMEPRWTASFRQGHLPPTLYHNCILSTLSNHHTLGFISTKGILLGDCTLTLLSVKRHVFFVLSFHKSDALSDCVSV